MTFFQFIDAHMTSAWVFVILAFMLVDDLGNRWIARKR